MSFFSRVVLTTATNFQGSYSTIYRRNIANKMAQVLWSPIILLILSGSNAAIATTAYVCVFILTFLFPIFNMLSDQDNFPVHTGMSAISVAMKICISLFPFSNVISYNSFIMTKRRPAKKPTFLTLVRAGYSSNFAASLAY